MSEQWQPECLEWNHWDLHQSVVRTFAKFLAFLIWRRNINSDHISPPPLDGWIQFPASKSRGANSLLLRFGYVAPNSSFHKHTSLSEFTHNLLTLSLLKSLPPEPWATTAWAWAAAACAAVNEDRLENAEFWLAAVSKFMPAAPVPRPPRLTWQACMIINSISQIISHSRHQMKYMFVVFSKALAAGKNRFEKYCVNEHTWPAPGVPPPLCCRWFHVPTVTGLPAPPGRAEAGTPAPGKPAGKLLTWPLVAATGAELGAKPPKPPPPDIPVLTNGKVKGTWLKQKNSIY